MVAKAGLTEADLAIIHEPDLKSQLPIRFENGAEWQQISSSCSECGEHIGPESIRARLSRPIPTVITMDAMAYCLFCNLYTPVRYRFRDDMTFDGRVPRGNGAWARWYPRRSGKIRQFLRRLGLTC